MYIRIMRVLKRMSPFLFILFLLSSCSINRIAVGMVADILADSGNGSLFTADDDPEFIADALPFALKMYEGLLESDPENMDLIEATAGGFVSYANAFLQAPAELLEFEKKSEKSILLSRAAAMYRRGGRYADSGLDKLEPGFSAAFDDGSWDLYLDRFDKDSVPLLYWRAAALLGEISIDSYNPGLLIRIPSAVALLVRILELEPDYNKGAVHELFISIHANMADPQIFRAVESGSTYKVRAVLLDYYAKAGIEYPKASVEDLVLYHLQRTESLSEGQKASPYISASAVYIKNQDIESYKALMNAALSVDPDSAPENRLLNIISQRKAIWLLEHIEDNFFML